MFLQGYGGSRPAGGADSHETTDEIKVLRVAAPSKWFRPLNSLFDLAFAERQHKGTLSAQLSRSARRPRL
jgi:hypothetical protein